MINWQPTRTGPRAVIGATTISVNSVPNHTYTETVWYYYANTEIAPKHSKVYLSPAFYDTEDAAKAGAERWVEKQGITQ